MSNIKIDLPIEAKNTFTIKKYTNNKLVQEEKVHNTVCDAFITCGYIFGKYLAVGSGAGTPSTSDTALFNEWYCVEYITSSYECTIQDNRIKLHTTYELPASSVCVGTITELGIDARAAATWSPDLLNHAMLVNSEGNPISIEKTDLDKIIIELDFFIEFAYPSYMIPIPLQRNIIYNQLCKILFKSPVIAVSLATSIEDASISNHATYSLSTYTSMTNSAFGLVDLKRSGKKYSCTNIRIPTEMSNIDNNLNCYFKALVIEGIGIIPLVNSDIFNTYSLPKVQIGIGDGISTEFINPYEYFVKDTDKVYINSQLLTRGIQYTIDNNNNASRLPELSEACEAKVIGKLYYYPTYQQMYMFGYSSLFSRSLPNLTNYSIYSSVAGSRFCYPVCNSETPMVLDMKKAVTCNTFSIPGRIANNGKKGSAVQPKIFLDYSIDGEEYTRIGEIQIDNTGIDKETSASKLLSFEPITARHWKVYTDTTDKILVPGINYELSSGSAARLQPKYDTALKCADSNYECFLGYVGDGKIRFTTPPPEGSIIELEVDMDRPFKNSNWVIDVSVDITL